MATDDVIFSINYGGRFDRLDKCMYIGGKIGVFDETYDLDCLSFIEIERIVKKYGYQPGDLIYYLQPDKSLDDGLVLLTCDDDILKMTEFLKGRTVVVLYTVAFGHGDEEDEPSDDDEEGERRRNKVINDPYWKSLMSSDDDAWDDGAEPEVGTSTRGNVYGKGDGEDGMDMEDCDDVDVVQRIDDDGVGGDGEKEEDDDDDEDDNSEFETINVGGSTHKALACIGQLLDDEEEDDVSSNMARSDVLVSPPASDEENEVDSRPRSRCVPKVSEFDEGDMGDSEGSKQRELYANEG
jgi:hypothetical protein